MPVRCTTLLKFLTYLYKKMNKKFTALCFNHLKVSYTHLIKNNIKIL